MALRLEKAFIAKEPSDVRSGHSSLGMRPHVLVKECTLAMTIRMGMIWRLAMKVIARAFCS